MSTLTTWLFAAALAHSPPEKLKQFPGHEETIPQIRERYALIVRDIVAAVGDDEKYRSDAALLLAWALGETRLTKDADVGPCYRGEKWKARCDSGAAAGLWQLHEAHDSETGKRFTLKEIFADRARAARFSLRKLRGAWHSCRHLAPEDRLSGFGLGHCRAGHAEVRKRFRKWLEVRAFQLPLQGPNTAQTANAVIAPLSEALQLQPTGSAPSASWIGAEDSGSPEAHTQPPLMACSSRRQRACTVNPRPVVCTT